MKAKIIEVSECCKEEIYEHDVCVQGAIQYFCSLCRKECEY